jgi:2,4-dienoyl-CoA reductase (NADPH2)
MMFKGHRKRNLSCVLKQSLHNPMNHENYWLKFHRNMSTQMKSEIKYPNLFEPLQLRGGITLKNRALMGSMHTGLEEVGLFGGSLEEMAGFYAERAQGGVSLIVTGGIAPNNAGRVYLGAAKMETSSEAEHHRIVTDAVHEKDGKIALQILHAGRYAYHPWPVSASAIKSPIGMYKPTALSRLEVSLGQLICHHLS